MKTNVLILVTEAIGGGVERLIYDQMHYYNREEFNLHVITLRQGYLEDEFSHTPATYRCLCTQRKICFKAISKLLLYIKKHHIEIVHTHLYLPDIYGFILKILLPSIKLFTTKHNTNQFRKNPFWGLLDNLLSIPATRIIAVSESVKRFISKYEYIPLRRIKVVYHGVDTERFRQVRKTISIRRSIGIPRNAFVVGIVGRITEQKGHKHLFDAVAALKKKISEIRLLVIGVGELQQELGEYSRILGLQKSTVFLGYRKDIPRLYSAMDVLCLPSLYEGLGLVLVEAMLCNIITVGTSVDGITEIINDGVNGFLVPPADSDALAKILYRIFKNEYDKKMLIEAKKTAMRFDYRENLKKIEREYLMVVGSNYTKLPAESHF
jgi:glycosyltransferase involved in cell wall biosynthesis